MVAATSIAAFVLGAFLMTFLAAGSIYEYSDTVRAEDVPEGVEVVVCLAGGRGRIRFASEIWLKHWERRGAEKAPVFYVAGAGAGVAASRAILESQMRKEVGEILLKQTQKLVIEDQSVNTVENAEFFSREARKRGWRHTLLITSSYHMKRSRMIFEQIAGREWDLQLETLSAPQAPFTSESWKSELKSVRVTLDEFLKLVFYKAFWTPPRAT
jgi:uncharacterized SAM-binding protein YcdF (DUF218 family)